MEFSRKSISEGGIQLSGPVRVIWKPIRGSSPICQGGGSPSQAVGVGVTLVAGGGDWCTLRVPPAQPWKGHWSEAKSTERKFNKCLSTNSTWSYA